MSQVPREAKSNNTDLASLRALQESISEVASNIRKMSASNQKEARQRLALSCIDILERFQIKRGEIDEVESQDDPKIRTVRSARRAHSDLIKLLDKVAQGQDLNRQHEDHSNKTLRYDLAKTVNALAAQVESTDFAPASVDVAIPIQSNNTDPASLQALRDSTNAVARDIDNIILPHKYGQGETPQSIARSCIEKLKKFQFERNGGTEGQQRSLRQARFTQKRLIKLLEDVAQGRDVNEIYSPRGSNLDQPFSQSLSNEAHALAEQVASPGFASAPPLPTTPRPQRTAALEATGVAHMMAGNHSANPTQNAQPAQSAPTPGQPIQSNVEVGWANQTKQEQPKTQSEANDQLRAIFKQAAAGMYRAADLHGAGQSSSYAADAAESEATKAYNALNKFVEQNPTFGFTESQKKTLNALLPLLERLREKPAGYKVPPHLDQQEMREAEKRDSEDICHQLSRDFKSLEKSCGWTHGEKLMAAAFVVASCALGGHLADKFGGLSATHAAVFAAIGAALIIGVVAIFNAVNKPEKSPSKQLEQSAQMSIELN